jgi:hypothetical protein
LFGTSLEQVWEMFGKCLEHSLTDYQNFNIYFWEMFGKCLGNVWEMFGKCLGNSGKKNGGIQEKRMEGGLKTFFLM